MRYALFTFLGLSLLPVNNTAALSVAPVCLTAQGYHLADIALGSNGESVEKMMAAQGHQRRRASPNPVQPRVVLANHLDSQTIPMFSLDARAVS